MVEAARELALPISPLPARFTVNDRSRAQPRANNAILDAFPRGFTIGLSDPLMAPRLEERVDENGRRTLVENFVPPSGAGLEKMLFNVSANTRADVTFDSTRLGSNNIVTGGFAPALIPAPKDPFFGTGVHSNVFSSNVGSNLMIAARADTDLTSVKVQSELQTFVRSNGETGVRFRQLYGQLDNLVAGQTDSFFADPDCLPSTLDYAGPNSQIYQQHPVLGLIIPFKTSEEVQTYVGVSAEAPEVEVEAPKDFGGYARVPDFAAKYRYENKRWGHLQVSALVRDLGVENEANTIHDRTVGWGTHFSVLVHPFAGSEALKNDAVSAAVNYGRGLGSYMLDLRINGKSDAVLGADNQLRSLPAVGYYAGYTHFWWPHLQSTIVYSQVDLYSASTNAAGFYRVGRYLSGNLVYQWTVFTRDDSADSKGHIAFVGIEYLYGVKSTLGNGSGDDQRIQIGAGINF